MSYIRTIFTFLLCFNINVLILYNNKCFNQHRERHFLSIYPESEIHYNRSNGLQYLTRAKKPIGTIDGTLNTPSN